MTSRQRTQVYLDHDEHLRLRRLAAERGLPMTEIVREAVARYLTQERGGGTDRDGDVAPAGPEGLGARMRARLEASADDSAGATSSAMSDEDRDIARGLVHKLGRTP